MPAHWHECCADARKPGSPLDTGRRVNFWDNSPTWTTTHWHECCAAARKSRSSHGLSSGVSPCASPPLDVPCSPRVFISSVWGSGFPPLPSHPRIGDGVIPKPVTWAGVIMHMGMKTNNNTAAFVKAAAASKHKTHGSFWHCPHHMCHCHLQRWG